MAQYRSSWWSIDLLPGWSAEQSPECTSFARPDGVGAFQISAHNYEGEAIPADDLDEFIQGEFPQGTTPESVTCGVLSGLGVDYIAEGNFWLKRWLHEGPLLLYVTYNCDAANRAIELSDVNSMLATLKPLSAG